MTRKFFGTDGIRGRANNPTLRITGWEKLHSEAAQLFPVRVHAVVI